MTLGIWRDLSVCFSHALYLDFQDVALYSAVEKVGVAGNTNSVR